MNTSLHKSNRWNVHLFLAFAGTTGIVGLFLPFSYDTSPILALLNAYVWQLGFPFFLSIFIIAATIRWIITGALLKVEKVIAYFVSVVAIVVTLSFIFNGEMWPSNFQEWLSVLISIAVLLSGAFLVYRNSKKRTTKVSNPLIAMQTAYLTNCMFCLVSFWPNGHEFFSGGLQIGAYFCLAASIVYIVQIALFLTQRNENSIEAEVTVP